MGVIKPLASLRAPAGKVSLKPGADSIRFGAALARKKGQSSNEPSKREVQSQPKPVNAGGREPAAPKGLKTVGFAKDPFTGKSREIRTFSAQSSKPVQSAYALAQQTKAKTSARALVKVARPLDSTTKLGAFMSDPEHQSKMREGLSELEISMDHNASIDDLDDVEARDKAMIKGLYVLASRQ